MNIPKLRLAIRDPSKSTASQNLSKAASKKAASIETIDEAWDRIFEMKNSNPDIGRISEVRSAMIDGRIGRDSPDKKFTKAEALRMWRILDEQNQAERLRKMVEEMPNNYWLITDANRFAEFLCILEHEEEIVFDVESTGVDIYNDHIVGHVITAVNADIHAYIPTKHDTERKQLPHDFVNDLLRPIYEDEAIGKIAHNAKFDIHMLAREGITLRGLTWDTQVAMHVLNENERFEGRSFQLKDIVTYYLKEDSATYSQLFGKRGFDEIELDIAVAYAAKDGDVTLKLRDFQRYHLEKVGLLDYYEQVENPVIEVSIEMERAGFVIDVERAKKLSKEMTAELVVIQSELVEHFGDINFNSPMQLAEVFYDVLGLSKHLKDKTARKTDVATLELLAPHHKGIERLLEYRVKTKLLGTYIDALPKQVQADGKVHGTFNQMGTVTGRYSANNPIQLGRALATTQ